MRSPDMFESSGRHLPGACSYKVDGDTIRLFSKRRANGVDEATYVDERLTIRDYPTGAVAGGDFRFTSTGATLRFPNDANSVNAWIGDLKAAGYTPGQ